MRVFLLIAKSALRVTLALCAVAAAWFAWVTWNDVRADAQLKEICGQLRVGQRVEEVRAIVDREGGRLSIDGDGQGGRIYPSRSGWYICQCRVVFNQGAVRHVSEPLCIG